MDNENGPRSEIILYQTDDGHTRVEQATCKLYLQVRLEGKRRQLSGNSG